VSTARLSWFSGMTKGVGGMEGVGGMLGSRLLRFQKPAFGPLVTKDNVQRDNPRNESGRWMAAVNNTDMDRMKAMLSTILIPRLPLFYPSVRQTGSQCSREDIQSHLTTPSTILNPYTTPTHQTSSHDTNKWTIPEIMWYKRKELSEHDSPCKAD